MVSNFVIFTRGRTGSTAIRAELDGHFKIVCYGELFHPQSVEQLKAKFALDPGPYDVFKKRIGDSDREYYERYLRETIKSSRRQKPDAIVGFKLLNGQAVAHKRKRLLRILSRQGFVFLHLIRRNIVRQAVSGMVAHKRGIFNAKNWSAAAERYELDTTDFIRRVNKYSGVVEKNRMLLSDHKCLEIYYEDFCGERDAFFSRIFDFLGIERFDLAPTEFSMMTDRNLQNVVKNFEELRQATRTLGLEHMLEAP
jgi:LPS sulfotransferase NodH